MCLKTVTIKAIDAVKCIREGMSDTALMERYNICAQGLQSLFTQLETTGILKRSELERRTPLSQQSVTLDVGHIPFPAAGRSKKPVINASDALRCINEGMDDATLMKKYRLSARGVQSLMKKLAARGLLSREAVKKRESTPGDTVIVDEESEVRHISAEEIDISGLLGRVQSGFRRKDLMEEYKVSATTLAKALKRLVAEGLMQQGELDCKIPAQSAHFEIRHRETGKVIHEGQSCSFAQFLEEAVSLRVDFTAANLSCLDLSRADLSGGRFSRADFRNACLLGTDFTGANLSKASFVSANLCRAVLYKANLADADLSDANLSMVYAMWAFLPAANLAECNLTHANLSGAHLANAHLFEAILRETDLTGAYLEGANLEAAKKIGLA
jgi:uncharacterized protein YjbI with pentapeptide repeats/predicted transcriptional regulator